MARKKVDEPKIKVGNINDVSGEINIAAGDIYKGFTAEQVSILITQITSTFQPKKFDGRCPYKGLDVFEEEDAELFFGREKLVDDLVDRVKVSRSLFITGPSGSGKSSLVRAGLIHALKEGAIKGSERWLYETMKPGRDPIAELARVVSSFAGTLNAGEDIRTKGLSDATILSQWCEIALKDSRDKRAVIFVDQFEEAFTQINKETERVAFLNLLTHAVTIENGRVIILFSMRSDFVSNCATYPQLNDLLNQQFIQIGAMQPDELVSAIAQPALRVGLRIDPDLVAQIINEMQGEPGALPLMQFALKDLFDSQESKGGMIALTLNDYLQRGGIHKALERHADASFAKLDENEQELARSIFSGLIEIGRGTQDTRRTAWFDELLPATTRFEDVQAVVQKLADARLITTDEQAGKDTVTISHEKLIDAWPWLKKLVNENRDVIALQNEIAEDAKEWEKHKRNASYLYTGARLVSANEKLKELVLSETALEYIRAGQARQQRGRLALIGSTSVIIAMLILAVIVFGNQSRENAALANQKEEIANTAQAASTLAVEKAEEAQKQANIALARQLAAQAQTLVVSRSSRQMTAVLLAVQSMKIIPSGEAAQILLNNNYSAHPISGMTHAGWVTSVAFSPDGLYVISISDDHIAYIWEVVTGKEIARLTSGNNVSAFSLDSKYVVLESLDNTARVWEFATGQEIARMTHDDFVRSVAFSPNGKYVISGSDDGTARVWEASTGEEVARMTHDGGVFSVAFSPDGRYVVSGSHDNTARVWETASGEEVARMTHDDWVFSVAFSPDGNYVFSDSRDNTVRIWETSTGKEVARVIHDGGMLSVAFSPDGKYVASGNFNGIVHVREAATGKEVARVTHDREVTEVAFSPDSKYVVSGSRDNTARVWEIATGEEVVRMTHDDDVYSVAFSPDGKYVVSGSFDNTARVWKASPRREFTDLIHDDWVNSVAFSPDGKYVASGSDDGTARVWEASTGEEIARMIHDGEVDSVAFSLDGKYVVSGSHDNTARVWEVTTGEEVARLTHDDDVKSVAFSPDGKYAVSGSWDNTLRVWETASGEEVARMTHDDWVFSVAFSPDGRYVVSGSWDDTTRVWEASTGKQVASLAHDYFPLSGVNSVAFSPNGKYVVSGSGDGTACVLETVTDTEVACMTHDGFVLSVAFSPDSIYLVSGSSDTTARVWEIATGKEVARLTHDDVVYSVTFSPDGKYVVSGSLDNTARVWETATGKEVARMIHNHAVYSVAFSPDGKNVVSGSWDNTARVWTWRLEDLIANACSVMPRNLTRTEWRQYIGDVLDYEAVCPNLPIEPEPSPTP